MLRVQKHDGPFQLAFVVEKNFSIAGMARFQICQQQRIQIALVFSRKFSESYTAILERKTPKLQWKHMHRAQPVLVWYEHQEATWMTWSSCLFSAICFRSFASSFLRLFSACRWINNEKSPSEQSWAGVLQQRAIRISWKSCRVCGKSSTHNKFLRSWANLQQLRFSRVQLQR